MFPEKRTDSFNITLLIFLLNKNLLCIFVLEKVVMLKNVYIVICLSMFSLCAMGQGKNACYHIKVLSADSLEGRKPGSQGIEVAEKYIRNSFKSYGLNLMFDEGSQKFEIITGIEAGYRNSFSYYKNNFVCEKDFIPLSFSNDTVISAQIVFAGYGFSIKNDSMAWNDYKDIDVKNKWVLVFRGSPAFIDGKNFKDKESDRNKMLTAREMGAAGIIFINQAIEKNQDELPDLVFEKKKSKSSMPALQITHKTAERLLKHNKTSLSRIMSIMAQMKKPYSFPLNGLAKIQTEISEIRSLTSNVVACVFSKKKTEKFIVIGAHYDHLGWGGQGSGSRRPDTVAIHNGADDNASGVGCLLELAEYFSYRTENLNYNLIFVAFSAEEMGLLGSAYFIKNPPVNKKNIKLMMNFDMMGRLNSSNRLSVGGTGTFSDSEKMLQNSLDSNQLQLSFTKEGYGPSDHASFYLDSIPVLYFNTGVHSDYHLPEDDFNKINCNGLQVITNYLKSLIHDLATQDYNLSYIESGSVKNQGKRTGLKVTLGIMPDFSNQDIKGVLVAGVNPKGAADNGGMLKNDVIVAIKGKAINDIYEYMEVLKSLLPGETITVDVIRNKIQKTLLIQL